MYRHKNKDLFILTKLMFTFLIITTVVTFFSNINVNAATSTNLVPHGDFETVQFDSWNLFYNSQKAEPSFNLDNKIFHGSTGHSGKIQGNNVSAYFQNDIPIEPGKVYSFSAWAKGDKILKTATESGGNVIIYQKDRSGKEISGTEHYFACSGTFNWEQYKYNVISASNATSLSIILLLDGTGSVWYDDVKLVESENIPTPQVLANPGESRSTFKGFNVKLDGSRSKGRSLVYNWRLISKPEGSQSSLVNSNSVTPNFVSDMVGDYVVALTVSSSTISSEEQSITIRVKEMNDTSDDFAYNLIGSSDKDYLDGYTLSSMKTLAGGWVILGDINKNKVVIVNAITGEVGKQYQLMYSPDTIDYNAEKNIIIATQKPTNKIAKIDINKDEITYINTSGESIALTFGQDNIAFSYLSNWPDGKISIIDIDKNVEIKTTSIRECCIGFMTYSKNNKKLFLGAKGISPSDLYQYSYDDINQQLNYELQKPMGANGQELSISNDGNHLAFCCGGGNVYGYGYGNGYTIYDIDASDIENNFGQWNTGAYPTSASFSLDNKYLLVTNSFQIKLFDVNSHSLIKTVGQSSYSGKLDKVGISRGGNILYGYGAGRIYFYKKDGDSPNSIPITLDSITTDKVGLQPAGVDIKITANTTGGSSEKYYKFYFYDGTNWDLAKSFSKDNTFVWTPKNSGSYTLLVEVRDKSSSKDYDDYKIIHFNISPQLVQHIKATPQLGKVSLTWIASQVATSYNIKRADSPEGPFTTLNSKKVTSLSYTDSAITNGNTYYYVVTAIANGNESPNSVPIQVKICSLKVTFNFDDRILKGIDDTIEYSLDGGKTYIKSTGVDMKLSESEVAKVTVVNGIIVRVAATDNISAGPQTKIAITAGTALPSTVNTDDVNNTIKGINTTMEYSLNSGTTWTTYTGGFSEDEKTLMSKNIMVNVRMKATGTKLAGAAKTFKFTMQAPKVSFDFDDRILKGITEDMEYSIDGGKTYKKSTGSDMILPIEEAAGITLRNGIVVREAAMFGTLTGPITKISFKAGTAVPSTVKLDDKNNTIIGMTISMEYSKDNGVTWITYSGSFSQEEKNLMSGNITVKVRMKATGTNVAGTSKGFVFHASV